MLFADVLIDENWNVKLGDFGFARIKQENAAMTRCGTPCYTGVCLLHSSPPPHGSPLRERIH